MGDLVIVDACRRGRAGGSPTAVLTDGSGLSAQELAGIPARAGTSHVAVLAAGNEVRFFTSAGELPACGHGTVAALAVLSSEQPFDGVITAGGRAFRATGNPAGEAWFDQGAVRLRPVAEQEQSAFLAALGIKPADLHPDERTIVASPGRERLLIPVSDRPVLASVVPDHDRLTEASHRFGQLGCFVYTPGTGTVARMFAPAIGVPEDVANANSTGCLAAYFLSTGRPSSISVDQGDALGLPSTVHATASRNGDSIVTRVGGTAVVRS